MMKKKLLALAVVFCVSCIFAGEATKKVGAVRILKPNGGETLYAGSTTNITWGYHGFPRDTPVRLNLIIIGFPSFTIVENFPISGDPGLPPSSFKWSIGENVLLRSPKPAPTPENPDHVVWVLPEYLIQIIVSNYVLEDKSDQPFKILPPLNKIPSNQVITPIKK